VSRRSGVDRETKIFRGLADLASILATLRQAVMLLSANGIFTIEQRFLKSRSTFSFLFSGTA
jgi:adenylosuccinate lyase